MPRTPFFSRIVSPAGGATSYTVPAGKLAICNAMPSDQGTAFLSATGVMKLNGVDTCSLGFQAAGPNSRIGPFVFQAGDVLTSKDNAFSSGTQRFIFSVNGFLYDASVRKFPLRQVIVSNSTSYTVAAGKYVVFNAFVGPRAAGTFSIKINGTIVGNILNGNVGASGLFGPFTANTGQTITVAEIPGTQGLSGAVFDSFLCGFLYNI